MSQETFRAMVLREDGKATLAEVEDLLRRGIACGAFADPWNILGFQGLFPLSPAREDSIRDPRLDELVQTVEQVFHLYARLLSEAAASGAPRRRTSNAASATIDATALSGISVPSARCLAVRSAPSQRMGAHSAP